MILFLHYLGVFYLKMKIVGVTNCSPLTCTQLCCLFLQIYGQGSGADCRKHVQKLNMMQGREIEKQEEEEDGEEEEEEEEDKNQDNLQVVFYLTCVSSALQYCCIVVVYFYDLLCIYMHFMICVFTVCFNTNKKVTESKKK